MTFDITKASVFTHRAQTVTAIDGLRTQMSDGVQNYYVQAATLIEEGINKLSASGQAVATTLKSQTQTACILNLIAMVNGTIENTGYAVSNCVDDVNGVVSTAFKSFEATLDAYERNVYVESQIVLDAFSGRNIFTSPKLVTNRITSTYNGKVTTFAGYVTVITENLNNVTTVYQDQLTILGECFVSLNDDITSSLGMISKNLATCLKFAK